MTWSLIAHDAATGRIGIAVATCAFAVGARVPHIKTGIGAVATQAWANTDYGPAGLALLAEGLAAQAALDRLTAADADAVQRQAGMVDAQGRAATFTGAGCFAWAGGVTGKGYAIQGNILASGKVVPTGMET